MNEPTKAGEHKGYTFYFQGISYNCPALKLWGFATDLDLIRAINRTLKNKARRERDQVLRDSGLVKVRGNLGGTYWE